MRWTAARTVASRRRWCRFLFVGFVMIVTTGLLVAPAFCCNDVLRHLVHQARSQVLRFDEGKYIFRGQDFCFVICLKQMFLGTTQFWGTQKIFWRALPPNAAPWLRVCSARIAELKFLSRSRSIYWGETRVVGVSLLQPSITSTSDNGTENG